MMAGAAIDPQLAPTDDDNITDMDVKTIPPISSAMPQPLQPSQDYRALPPPQQMYAPAYPPPMGYAPAQPAPRQRTAIACRYCRRRKVCLDRGYRHALSLLFVARRDATNAVCVARHC